MGKSDSDSDSDSSSENNESNNSSEVETENHSDTDIDDDSGRPQQLISFDRAEDIEESLILKLHSDVLDSVLKTCKGKPLCVIAVSGQARSGKSFLLNYIKECVKALEEDEEDNWMSGTQSIKGFDWKPGCKPTTEGIWIWSRAFIVDADGKEVAVLLMDTQGFDDETSPEEISAILGLSLLSSSISIITLINDIPEVVYRDSIFAKYGNLCQKKGFATPFQKLSFLIRDWTRLSENQFGEDSDNKLLNQLLKTQKDGKKFKKCWEEISTFLLPNIGSKAILKSFSGGVSQIDKEFAKHLKNYINDLTNGENLISKKIWGNEVNADEYGTFLKSFVAMFNKKSVVDLGLKPESIWTAHEDAASQIKLQRGVEAYKHFYDEIKEENAGGYLSDNFIDAMHIQAKDKAVNLFRKFVLPKEEEDQLYRTLDQLLQNENDNLKTENEGARRAQIAAAVGISCDNLRAELEKHFPFTPEAGLDIPPNMVFYEDDVLKETLECSSKRLKNLFLQEFNDEEEDGIRKLFDTIESVFEPILEEYTRKNTTNRNMADSAAKNAINKLLEDYSTAMENLLKQLPTMDAKVLEVFHGQQLTSIQQKFQSLKLGTSDYKREWLNELLEDINNVHETMEASLESTMAKALQIIREEVDKYKQILEEKAEELESEEDIRAFHDEAIEGIIGKFSLQNPFPKDKSKTELMLIKLRTSVESMFITVIEEGFVKKRKMEENLLDAVETAHKLYISGAEALLKKHEFLEPEEFEKQSSILNESAFETFIFKIKNNLLAPEIIEESRQKLVAKLEANKISIQTENDEKREQAYEDADTLSKELLEKHKLKMMEAVTKLETKEELVAEHNKWKEQIALNFKKQFKSKNEFLQKKSMKEMLDTAENSFAGVEEFFNLTQQTVNVTLMTAFLHLQTAYVDNMNKHFNNNSTFFKEDELNILHTESSKIAFDKLPADSQVSSSQKKQLEQKLENTFKKFKERNDLDVRSFEKHEPAIGIDLGTTYCCMAIYFKKKIQIISTENSGNIIPSYVRINDDDSKMFGQPAKEQAYESPETTIFDAKRIIGRRMDDEHLKNDMEIWPFTVVEHDGGPKIDVNGRKLYPEEISSYLLEHLKKEAEKKLGFPINKAVITVPAYFTDGQRAATVRAGELAGFEVLGLLNEPTAAAIAYRLDCCYDDKTKKILVFDLGGGTFDVAILEIGTDKLDVLCVNGDAHLGGEDFDRNMMKYCAEEFKRTTGVDLFKNKDSTVLLEKNEARRNLRRLQTRCENAKKALTTAPSVTLSIDAFVENRDLIVEIKRKKFEDLNEVLFSKTIAVVDEALMSANLKKEDIDEIVLVGGSTKIPKIQKKLQDHFNGRALNKQIDPDQAVAYGAAVQAAIKCAKPDEKIFDFGVIKEVTPMSLGIEMASGDFDVIIPKNTKIPKTLKQEYRTHRDDQANANVRILQGENPLASQNKLLGDFCLEGIPPGPAGTEVVEVTMYINANGILNVTATCKSTGSKKMKVVQEKGIMTEETKQRIIGEVPTKIGLVATNVID